MESLLELIVQIPTLTLDNNPHINTELLDQLDKSAQKQLKRFHLKYKIQIEAHNRAIADFLNEHGKALNTALRQSISIQGYLGRLIRRHIGIAPDHELEIVPDLIISAIIIILQQAHPDNLGRYAAHLSETNLSVIGEYMETYDLINLKAAIACVSTNITPRHGDKEILKQAMLVAKHYNPIEEQNRRKHFQEAYSIIDQVIMTISEMIEHYTAKKHPSVYDRINQLRPPSSTTSHAFLQILTSYTDDSLEYQNFINDYRVRNLREKYQIALHMQSIVDHTKDEGEINSSLASHFRQNSVALFSSTDSLLARLLHKLGKLLGCQYLQSYNLNKIEDLKRHTASCSFFQPAETHAMPAKKSNGNYGPLTC